MTKIRLAHCVIFMSLMAAFPVAGQKTTMTYSRNGLTLNARTLYDYTHIAFVNCGGSYRTYANSTKFFQFDLTGEHVSFSGTGDKILFYNSDAGKYTSIKVGVIYNLSDAKAKTNIQEFGEALKRIDTLRPVTYRWKQDSKLTRSEGADTVRQYGLLAQEAEIAFPDIVHESETGDKLINYTALVPVLVSAVKELRSELYNRKAVIDSLSSIVELRYPKASPIELTGEVK